MSEDRPSREGQDPTNPYGRPGPAGPGPAGRPGGDPAGSAERQQSAPQWSSATQRREHPGAGGPVGAAGWSGSPQAPGDRPVLRRKAGAASAFLVALLATLAGLAVSLLASYTAFHVRSLSLYARINLASGGLQTWPSGPRGSIGDLGRAGAGDFVLTYAVAAVLLLLLLWAVIGSTPGGRGVFAVLLAGWGASVVAGAVAVGVGDLSIAHHGLTSRIITLALDTGADWAIRVGWVVGVVAAIGQLMRRRDRYEI